VAFGPDRFISDFDSHFDDINLCQLPVTIPVEFGLLIQQRSNVPM